MPEVAPYGSWSSSITPEKLTERAAGLSQVSVDGDTVLWNEARPEEAGRQVLVSHRDGVTTDLLAKGFSARTAVHEYGGRCYVARGGEVVFSNQSDQRLWLQGSLREPVALTPTPSEDVRSRYADPWWSERGIVCVREVHAANEVRNDIVYVSVTGPMEVRCLVEGHDFFAAPRISADSRRIAWLTWDHPAMPWDESELWVADLGPTWELGASRRVAGGPGESVTQPSFDACGVLHYISDRSGWWNLYDEEDRALAPVEAELAAPAWALGESSYCFLSDGRIATTWGRGGYARIGLVEDGALHALPSAYSSFSSLAASGSRVAAVVGSPLESPRVALIDVDTGEEETLKLSRAEALDASEISVGEPFECETSKGEVAHALYYPPKNPSFEAPPDGRPPLVVNCHGGPTGAASPVLNLAVQFWTSRGVAYLDVNYRGSSGYGRGYRESLRGRWGVADVEDCIAAARILGSQGRVDPSRMAVRGSSAGGLSALGSICASEVFAACASRYGVSDLEALALETHKFESRYMDGLVGPYPRAAELYRERSPTRLADKASCPVLLLQGSEDPVVPPSQSQAMAETLRRNGIPAPLVLFEGESHGFRRSDTLQRAAGIELEFFGLVLGFAPSDSFLLDEEQRQELLAWVNRPLRRSDGSGGLERGDRA